MSETCTTYGIGPDKYADELQTLRDERDRLANDLKKRIWLLHGSRLNHLLYGDDGRMDCNVCFREYAGATLEQCYEWEISDACALVTKAALTPAGQRWTRKITGRDKWRCRVALIRFMQEASPDQLVQVSLYAATVMVNAAPLTPDGAA